MRRKKVYLLAFIIWIVLFVLLINPLETKGAQFSKKEVFKLLQKAYLVQVSLSDEQQTMEEIIDQLSPYFEDKIMTDFLEENLIFENGKYLTLGTDYAIYYVPYFSYSEKTMFHDDGEKIFVYEYFPKKDNGPISYESHYEGVLLKNNEGNWKIADIYKDFPIENIKKISFKAWITEEKEKYIYTYFYPFSPSLQSLYQMNLFLVNH